MKYTFLVVSFLLSASLAYGQVLIPRFALSIIPEVTVAELPSGAQSGTVRIVTDGSTSSDCDTGGGANRVFCGYDGTGGVWAALGVIQSADYEFTGTVFDSVALASLPTVGSAGRFRWVNDCESLTACSTGGGTAFVLFYDDGTEWVPRFLGGSGSQSFSGVMAQGNTYFGADCTADKAVIIGRDADNAWWDCHDETTGLRRIPVVDGVPDGADKVTYVRDAYSAKVQNLETGNVPFSVAGDGTAAVLKGLPSGFGIAVARDGGLEDTDDFANRVRIPFDQTIVEVCAITDTGTSTVNIQRNDGSAANILSSNLTAATTEACSTSFTSGEEILSEGHYINFVMVTAAASGTPTKVTLSVRTRRD